MSHMYLKFYKCMVLLLMYIYFSRTLLNQKNLKVRGKKVIQKNLPRMQTILRKRKILQSYQKPLNYRPHFWILKL